MSCGGSRGRAFAERFSARVGLLPLGLALFVFPTVWDTGVEAF